MTNGNNAAILFKTAILNAVSNETDVSTTVIKTSNISKKDIDIVEKEILDFIGYILTFPIRSIINITTVGLVNDYINDESERLSILLSFLYRLSYEVESLNIEYKELKKLIENTFSIFINTTDSMFEERITKQLESKLLEEDLLEENKWFFYIILLRLNVENDVIKKIIKTGESK